MFEHTKSFFVGLAKKVSTRLLTQEISIDDANAVSSFLPYFENTDVVAKRKSLKKYQDMKQDDQIKASLQIKKDVRLASNWQISPQDKENEKAQEIADEITYNLMNMRNTFESQLKNILSAFEYGFSITEKIFTYWADGPYKGHLRLADLKTREPFNYKFKKDDAGNTTGLINTQVREGYGTIKQPYPIEKFLIYSHNKEFNNDYGESDLKAAYTAWFSKDIIIKFYNIYLERFAMPSVIAKYDTVKGRGNKEVIDEIDAFLKRLSVRTGLRIPKSVEIELLEVATSNGDAYLKAIDKYDRMISRALLVPSLLQDNDTKGSYALGKSHFDVFLLILDTIGNELSKLIREDIIRPLVMINYGANIDRDLIPNFAFEGLNEEDVEVRTKIVTMLAEKGLLNPKETWVRDYLQLPEQEEFEEENIPQTPKATSPVAPQSAPEDTPLEDTGDTKKGADQKISKESMSLDEPKLKTRDLTLFEHKVNFKQILTRSLELEREMKDDLQEVLIEWKKEIKKTAKKILDNKDIKEIKNILISQKNMSAFKNTLIKYYEDIHAEHNERAEQELNKVLNLKKEFVKNPRVLAALHKYYTQKAFIVTGEEATYITNAVKHNLTTAIAQTASVNTVNVDIDRIFEKYIDSNELRAGKIIKASRLNAVVRTVQNEALNKGRKAYYEDPEVRDSIQYYQWSSIMDERTSPYCEEMDGKIFRKGEFPEPPAHENCRSTIVPITNIEVKQLGKRGEGIKLTTPADITSQRQINFCKECE